jgi:hypothetical protein
MHPLAELPYVEIELHWQQDLPGPPEQRARQLRGALARRFADDDVFHQHSADGKPLYRYPQVQYRWLRGHGVVAGWGEAALKLLQLPWLDLELQLSERPVEIIDVFLNAREAVFAVSPRLLRYRLVSPVLLFNQENYRHYCRIDADAQRAERDRLLIAMMLNAMKGLEVFFDAHLYAAFATAKTRDSRYKGQRLIGISGEILTNALLPDGFALGHGVSHGYGWLTPVE